MLSCWERVWSSLRVAQINTVYIGKLLLIAKHLAENQSKKLTHLSKALEFLSIIVWRDWTPFSELKSNISDNTITEILKIMHGWDPRVKQFEDAHQVLAPIR